MSKVDLELICNYYYLFTNSDGDATAGRSVNRD